MHKKYSKTREAVKDLVLRNASGKVLDVGAGTAKYRKIIKSKVDEYITCDINPGDNIDFVEDARSLSFADNSFNTIISFETLEHVYPPEEMIKEIYRCLKEEGRCVLTVPFLIPEHNDPGDYQRYTRNGIKNLFELHGFEVVEYGSYGGFYTVMEEFLKFKYINPYSAPHGKIRKKVIVTIIKLLYWLDAIFYKKDTAMYANVFIVAKK